MLSTQLTIVATGVLLLIDSSYAPTSSLGVGAFVLGVLLNCGALAWWVRSGTDMKMAQRDATEAKKKAEESLTEMNILKSRVNQQDTIINEIRSRMSPIDRIPELYTMVKNITEVLDKNMIPREAVEQRFVRLEEDVKTLREDT